MRALEEGEVVVEDVAVVEDVVVVEVEDEVGGEEVHMDKDQVLGIAKTAAVNPHGAPIQSL